jgi:hypothetical protein
MVGGHHHHDKKSPFGSSDEHPNRQATAAAAVAGVGFTCTEEEEEEEEEDLAIYSTVRFCANNKPRKAVPATNLQKNENDDEGKEGEEEERVVVEKTTDTELAALYAHVARSGKKELIKKFQVESRRQMGLNDLNMMTANANGALSERKKRKKEKQETNSKDVVDVFSSSSASKATSVQKDTPGHHNDVYHSYYSGQSPSVCGGNKSSFKERVRNALQFSSTKKKKKVCRRDEEEDYCEPQQQQQLRVLVSGDLASSPSKQPKNSSSLLCKVRQHGGQAMTESMLLDNVQLPVQPADVATRQHLDSHSHKVTYV